MLEAEAFEDRAAGRQRVDEEVLRAAGDRVARAGGDERAVKPAAAVGRDRTAAVQPAEPASRVRVEPADADWCVAGIRDVAADLWRAGANAVGEFGFKSK